MRLTAVFDDERVIVNGVARDTPGIAAQHPDKHALQHADGVTEVEYTSGANATDPQGVSSVVDELKAAWDDAELLDIWNTSTGERSTTTKGEGVPSGYTDTKPESVRVREVYEAALQRLGDGHAEALEEIDRRYPLSEKLGWHRLDYAIDKYQADGTVTSGLQKYADALDVSVPDAVTRLSDTIEAFDTQYGEATGKLTKLRDEADALRDAGDVAALEALQWTT